MRLLSYALAATLAVGVVAAPGTELTAAHAADDYTPAAWEKQFAAKVTSNIRKVNKTADWCEKNGLEWTGMWVRRHGYVLDPDHADLRAELGYERGPDNEWVQNELKRDQLRDFIDEEDPNAGKFPKNMAKMRKSIAKDFAALARKATKEAENTGNSTFTGQAKKAWEMVVNITESGTKENNAAHKALGHPQFDGRYVWPEMLPYREARQRRKKAGEALAATKAPTEKAAPEGTIVKAGFPAATATTVGPFRVQSVYKQESSDRLATWAFRAMSDIVEQYGFPPTIAERMPKVLFDYVEAKDDKSALKQYLSKGAGWEKARIEQLVKHFSATSIGNGNVFARDDNRGADDSAAHNSAHIVVRVAQNMALSDLGGRLGHSLQGVENWMREAISYDCTRRLLNSSSSRCGSFGRYGVNFTARPGEDVWLQLAKRQVELDDDVPISELYRKKINDLGGPETVKSYALIQFLFEHDQAQAQKFVWHAVAHGTPAAIVDVYGSWLGTPEPSDDGATTDAGSLFQRPEYRKAMNELDKRYRVWIVRTQ